MLYRLPPLLGGKRQHLGCFYRRIRTRQLWASQGYLVKVLASFR